MCAEKYVIDEVFRSEIRRIEQQVDNAVERIELKMDVYTAQNAAVLEKMNGGIDRIESKIDVLRSFMGWAVGLMAVIATVITIIIPLIK